MSRLPASLEREIADDLKRFGVQHGRVAGQVILTAAVRGVPVVLYLGERYPAEPPRIELSAGWSWRGRGRRVRGLGGQEHWNRTLGIGALLRELEQKFAEEPPARVERPRERQKSGILRVVKSFFTWLWNLILRLFGAASERPEKEALSDAIRSRYRQIIDEKTERIARYRQAVVQMMTQWHRKNAAVEELAKEIQRLDKSQEENLAKAERLVAERKAAGRTEAEIKADALYQRALGAYEERATDLEEMRKRFAELEADAKEHHERLREHKAQLETLVRELEELEDESAGVSAELAAVELEKEIVDLRAGISRAGSEEELRKLMREFRKTKAEVKITKEIADLEDTTAKDAEYMEVARRVTAAKRFESSVGLGEAAGPVREEERER